MSPQEVEPQFRSRGRSNTTTFATFPWRRAGRNDPPPPTTPALPEPTTHSVDELITALSPPAVPSLSAARSLSAALPNASTVQLSSLTPILASLCEADAPASLRTAGYDILTAFLERSDPPLALRASERIALFSLFTARGHNAWHADVWEARFRAFTAFTRGGAEIAGVEPQLLDMLQTWIDGAFAGLLLPTPVVGSGGMSSSSSSSERAERERSVDMLGSFLTATTSRPEILARLSESTIGSVLNFFGGLIERALASSSSQSDPSLWYATYPEIPQGASSSIPPTPTRTTTQTHRRHHSSASLSLSIAAASSSPVTPSPLAPPPPPPRRPADIAMSLYLDHLDAQARYLSPIHLKTILPVLFRSLALNASHLPRLSLSSSDQFELSHSQSPYPLERHIVDVLDPILNGPYTASCFIILRQHLQHHRTGPGAWRVSVQTATGACRTLRIFVRRALCTRLARSYIARISNNPESSGPSGGIGIGGVNLEHGLVERAWSKDEFTRGDLGKVGRLLRRAAEAWVGAVRPEEEGGGGGDAEREDVLLEIAGALRDIFQEYDERADDIYDIEVAEDETNVVGETLLVLARYIQPLKCAPLSLYLSLFAVLIHWIEIWTGVLLSCRSYVPAMLQHHSSESCLLSCLETTPARLATHTYPPSCSRSLTISSTLTQPLSSRSCSSAVTSHPSLTTGSPTGLLS
jgi:tuberous sclerosis 2